MATVQRNRTDSLGYNVITAVDEGGVATIKKRNQSHLNTKLTDDEVRLLGVDIASLQKYELDSVTRTTTYELAQE